MECRERLESFLREHGVAFQYQQHAQAFTAQEIAAAEHVPGSLLAKVVILVAGDDLAMVALPAPEHVDLAKASTVIGVKNVRLADESEFSTRFGDCELGAMPPFGNLYDLPVYVDTLLAKDDTIVFNAGSHTETMSLKYGDFEQLVHPTVADIAVQR